MRRTLARELFHNINRAWTHELTLQRRQVLPQARPRAECQSRRYRCARLERELHFHHACPTVLTDRSPVMSSWTCHPYPRYPLRFPTKRRDCKNLSKTLSSHARDPQTATSRVWGRPPTRSVPLSLQRIAHHLTRPRRPSSAAWMMRSWMATASNPIENGAAWAISPKSPSDLTVPPAAINRATPMAIRTCRARPAVETALGRAPRPRPRPGLAVADLVDPRAEMAATTLPRSHRMAPRRAISHTCRRIFRGLRRTHHPPPRLRDHLPHRCLNLV